MRGSIVKRTDKANTYSIVIDEGKDPETGKRRQHWITFHGKRKEAEKELSKMLNQVYTGYFVKPTDTTIKAHFDEWLSSYVAANLAARTHELYCYICKKHIYPSLQQITLTGLKPQHIQKLHAEKKKSGLSNRTIQIIHNVLHKGLDNAVKTGLLAFNPVDRVEYPKIQRHEHKTLSDKDIMILLEMARTSEYYPLFYTIIFTGMRRSEALSLNWSDVDLENKKISVNKTMEYLDSAAKGEKIKFKAPKTEKSRRYISITESNTAVLKEHLQSRLQYLKTISMKFDPEKDFDKTSELVFCHTDGSPYTPNGITHSWIKLVRRCSLTGIRLHDCRHSFATILLKANVHPSVVAAQLGHASVSTTLNVYSHVVDGLQDQAAQLFDKTVLPINR